MLQDSLSKIKYLVVLAVLLVLPMQAKAGFLNGVPIVNQTDTGTDRIVAFWDTRDRDTFIQVTNTSDAKINIHVQIYDINGSGIRECNECNFDDMLTANDTHVYDIENIMTNAIPSLLIPSIPRCTEIAEGTHGMIVISFTGVTDGGKAVDPLIGTFRIIDEIGNYEYRANAAGQDDSSSDDVFSNIINFSSANGNDLSDLVGIVYAHVSESFVYASPGVQAKFGSVGLGSNFIWDEHEGPQSCSPTTFACADGFMDKGIDSSLPNSITGSRVCDSAILNSNSSGWLDLEFDQFNCFDSEVGNPATGECGIFGGNETPLPIPVYFVGFIGLNNGDGTGSMDSWWAFDEGLLNGKN